MYAAPWRLSSRRISVDVTLDHRLQAIGFRLALSVSAARASRHPDADIERTLIDALAELPSDRRLASLLFTWVKVHGAHVIVEKLRKLAGSARMLPGSPTIWLSALAAFAIENGDRKWSALLVKPPMPLFLYPVEFTRSAIALKGAIPWLESAGFLLPAGSLRIREDDVLSPAELIRRNRQYRNRYLYGASWRADIITAIEEGHSRPAAIVRRVGCSYEPAHRIFNEYMLATAP